MVNLTYHVRPSTNDGFEASSKKMLVECGHGYLLALLWDRGQGKVDSLELYHGVHEWPVAWGEILQQSVLLNFRNIETEVLFNGERVLPTPSFLYGPGQMAGQIAALHGRAEGVRQGGDILLDEGMVMAWEAPNEVYETLCSHFQVVQFRSLASLLVSIGRKPGGTDNRGLMVVSGPLAWFCIWKAETLLLVRSIATKEPEDAAYFMLNATQCWGLEPGEVYWQVGGFLEPGSPLWAATERFFPHFLPIESCLPGNQPMPGYNIGHLAQYLAG